MEVAAISDGEMLNYSNIASDCGVTAKTVKSYFQDEHSKSVKRTNKDQQIKVFFILFCMFFARWRRTDMLEWLRVQKPGRILELFLFVLKEYNINN